MPELKDLFEIMRKRGGAMYGGEDVTQLQHALQCATLAMQENASDALITAALFHDIGHLISEDDAKAAEKGIDLAHEEVAADYLAELFGPEVTEPIRMHVPAKRYLCTVEPGYIDELSDASKLSLNVQGGPFDEAEAAFFISNRFGKMAVQLRRWDDLGKDPEMTTLSLDSFREQAQRCLT